MTHEEATRWIREQVQELHRTVEIGDAPDGGVTESTIALLRGHGLRTWHDVLASGDALLDIYGVGPSTRDSLLFHAEDVLSRLEEWVSVQDLLAEMKAREERRA